MEATSPGSRARLAGIKIWCGTDHDRNSVGLTAESEIGRRQWVTSGSKERLGEYLPAVCWCCRRRSYYYHRRHCGQMVWRWFSRGFQSCRRNGGEGNQNGTHGVDQIDCRRDAVPAVAVAAPAAASDWRDSDPAA